MRLTFRKQFAEGICVMLGQGLALELIVTNDVDSFSLSQQRWLDAIIASAEDAISEFDYRSAQQCGSRFDKDFVVVAGGRSIATIRFNDGENALVLLFKLAVSKAERAQQFDAAKFKPYEIIRIVDDAHLIRFRVPHADLMCCDRHFVHLLTHPDAQSGYRGPVTCLVLSPVPCLYGLRWLNIWSLLTSLNMMKAKKAIRTTKAA